jgi:polyphosphate kinase 2 (PPK2 family)
VLKFFLHVSKQEQRQRLLARLDDPTRQWKFSPADLVERSYFDTYQQVDAEVLTTTSSSWAPWYVIPADHKPATRALVSAIAVSAINDFELRLPSIGEEQARHLEGARKALAAH